MARMRAPQRRRQLLETAAEVFAERGYHGATTAELARAAGVAEPILYRHFENKLALFVCLIEEVGREVLATWQANLDGVAEPQARLRVLLQGNPATHERGRAVYRVIFQAMTDAGNDREVARAIRDHVNALHAFLEGELRRLQKAAVVRKDIAPAGLAAMLVDVAVGFGILSPLRVSKHAKTGMQQMLLELLTAGPGDAAAGASGARGAKRKKRRSS